MTAARVCVRVCVLAELCRDCAFRQHLLDAAEVWWARFFVFDYRGGSRWSRRQLQILRLTTPKLHPKGQMPSFGDPGLKKALGARALRMTAGRVWVNPSVLVELCRDCALRQHGFDAADGLSCAFFVLYQAEADVGVAVVAEAYAGADGYFGFVEQQL
jgi:hypothetical protein